MAVENDLNRSRDQRRIDCVSVGVDTWQSAADAADTADNAGDGNRSDTMMRFLLACLALLLASLSAAATTALRYDWGASTDPAGTGVFKYNIRRCAGAACTPSGAPIGSATTNTYFDTTTTASTTYCYTASAVDENGNESGQNAPACKTSLAYATVNAATNSNADVQTAINNANDGDLVLVPTGTVTWTGTPQFSASKGVTLQCATIGMCNVTVTNTCVSLPSWSSDNNFFYRISGFNFTNTANGSVCIWFSSGGGSVGDVTNVRFDHNSFNLQAGSVAIFLADQSGVFSVWGVADHNTVTSSGGTTPGNVALAQIFSGHPRNPPHSNPQGTARNFFMEDNSLTFTTMTDAGQSCQDAWGGGEFVYRHNTSTNCLSTAHGVTHSGGPQNAEFYSNSYSVNSGATGQGEDDCFRCIHVHGSGSYLSFSNRFTETKTPRSTDVVAMLDYRAYDNSIDSGIVICDGNYSTSTNLTTSAATASGNVLTFASLPAWAQGSAFGYIVTDITHPSVIPAGTTVLAGSSTTTISLSNNVTGGGVGSGDTIGLAFPDGGIDGNRTPIATYRGYPCWHQPTRAFDGTLSPAYSWDNAWSDTLAATNLQIEDLGAMPSFDYTTQHLQLNRDVYVAVSASANSSPSSPFDGTTGMGFGTLANRPVSCSTGNTDATDAGFGGVGYFATDKGPQGTLYRCATTNHWPIHYQPYSQFNDGVTASGRHPLTSLQ